MCRRTCRLCPKLSEQKMRGKRVMDLQSWSDNLKQWHRVCQVCTWLLTSVCYLLLPAEPARQTTCTLCRTGSYSFNGNYVPAKSNGISRDKWNDCGYSNKNKCERMCIYFSLSIDHERFYVNVACGAKCTPCKIPNFIVASIVSQLQCTLGLSPPSLNCLRRL